MLAGFIPVKEEETTVLVPTGIDLAVRNVQKVSWPARESSKSTVENESRLLLAGPR